MKIILCFSAIFCLSGVTTQTFDAIPPYHLFQRPNTCLPNETLVQCKQQEPTCSLPNPGFKSFNVNCKPGCTCKLNSLRVPFGGCVLPHNCPNMDKCNDGEEFKYCTDPCPRTCESCFALDCGYNKCGKKNACDCKSGFFRSYRTGKCTPASLCVSCPVGSQY